MMSTMPTRDQRPEQTEARNALNGTLPITVVLADDHKVVRSGLRLLLESEQHFEVLAETGDVAGTVDAVIELRPRVLVLDLNMGGESALEAIPGLRADAPETQIVVLDDAGQSRFRAGRASGRRASATCSRTPPTQS